MEPAPEKRKRTRIARFFRLIIIVFSLLVVLAGLAAVLLYVYRDDVTAAILKELNRHLKAEVRVEPKNIDLTLVRSFPDCSLQFRNLTMLEPGSAKKKDTLLYADFLNLHFSLKDLWNGKYIIKEISLSGADARLKIDKNGKRNFIFWEQAPASAESNTEFDLEKIHLSKSRIYFHDYRSDFESDVDITDLVFSGRFKSDQFDLNSEARLYVTSIRKEKRVFLRKKKLDYAIELDVTGSAYKVKKAEFMLNRLNVSGSGRFMFDKEISDLVLQFKAPSLDIGSLLSLLPPAEQKRVGDYHSEGVLYAEGKLSYDSPKQYSLKTKFGIKNSSITYKPTGMRADNVNLEGTLDLSNRNSDLVLKNVGLNLGNDGLTGELQIHNFDDPEIDLRAQANLQLENWQKFWPVDTIQEIKGAVTLTTSVIGNVKEISKQLIGEKVSIFLETSIKDLSVRFKHDNEPFAVDNCHLIAQDREIMVDNLQLRRGSSDLTVNGRLPGLLTYLLDPTNLLTISGTLSSNYIRMEDFLSAAPGTASTEQGPIIPQGVNFKLDASIGKFTFGKFTAKDIVGDLEIRDRKAIVNEVSLNCAGGTASISAFMDNSKNRLAVMLQSQINGIDINQLFTEMNNFGQTSIEDKNLRGKATINLDFSGVWDNKLVIDDKTIQANCNVLIERGELIDFKPLLHLSKFVDVNDLKRIRFSTLKSNIRISDRVVQIPHTAIKNSALNVEFWGTHDFDNQIDYHIQLFISELLAKRRKSKDSEFGEVITDTEKRWTAIIRMTGDVDNPRIRYDKQGMKEKINQDIKQEKQALKQLIREEFGLFKKDSSLRRTTEPKPEFKLEEEKPAPKKPLELKKKEEEDF